MGATGRRPGASTALPSLTCGNENCALNRSQRKDIEGAEMSFLRNFCGCSLTDHARNALKIYMLYKREANTTKIGGTIAS